MEEELFKLIRSLAEGSNRDLDRQQLKYNEIVNTAKLFYPSPVDVVIELFQSCIKDSPLYVRKKPMWLELQSNYKWMII